MIDGYKQGEVSEWNEGNFKTLRLHQAQDLINKCLINPFSKMSFGAIQKWGYELWLDGINILLGEGIQKYSEAEKKEILKDKEDAEELLEKSQICSPIKSGNRIGIEIDKDLWKEYKKKVETYEYKVKSLNDKHGLSTRNKGTQGLF